MHREARVQHERQDCTEGVPDAIHRQLPDLWRESLHALAHAQLQAVGDCLMIEGSFIWNRHHLRQLARLFSAFGCSCAGRRSVRH